MDVDREAALKLACEEMKNENLDSPIKILVMGGFALSYYCSNRYTIDIDYLLLDPILMRQHEILEKYSIDNRVNGMIEFDVGDIEVECSYTIGNVVVCIPTIEWLTLSKLTSSRGKDLYDLKEYKMIDMCDKEILVKELREILSYKICTREWNYKEFDLFNDL